MQFIFTEILPLIVTPIVMIGILLIYFMVIRARYTMFPPNVFVIHIRRGKVKIASTGGAFFKMPIFDQCYTIPMTLRTVNLTLLHPPNVTNQKGTKIEGSVVWRVQDPELAFKTIESFEALDQTLVAYLDPWLQEAIQEIPDINLFKSRIPIMDKLQEKLQGVVGNWGLRIEQFHLASIRKVHVK